MAISKATEQAGASAHPTRRLSQRERKALATAESYTPTTSADWTVQPSDQDDALDKLAARLKIVESDEQTEATGTITSLQLQAINATPVTLVAAPGAGKLIVVEEIELFHDFDTAAYDAGAGNITIQYAAGPTAIETISDNFMDTVSADAWAIGRPELALADLTAEINQAVQLTTATADFAVTGGGAGVLKYRVRYRVVTLLS